MSHIFCNPNSDQQSGGEKKTIAQKKKERKVKAKYKRPTNGVP